MKEFWKWFQLKTGFTKLTWTDQYRECWMQTLIGFMNEYLLLRFKVIVGIPDNFFTDIAFGKKYDEVMYKYLESKIKTEVLKLKELMEELTNLHSHHGIPDIPDWLGNIHYSVPEFIKCEYCGKIISDPDTDIVKITSRLVVHHYFCCKNCADNFEDY